MNTKLKRFIAGINAAMLLICMVFSNAGIIFVKADTGSGESSVLTKLTQDTVLTYNPDSGNYEGTAQLKVNGIQEDQCIVINVNDIRDTNGCTLDVVFVDSENSEEMTFKNGDVITVKYSASNYQFGVTYDIELEVKGVIKKDYRAFEIPELLLSDWEYTIDGSDVVLDKYIGTATEVVVYPKYSVNGDVYDTRMAITDYDTTYRPTHRGDDYDSGDYEDSNVIDASGPFVENTDIEKVVFLDGVRIGKDSSTDTVVCADTLNDYCHVGGEISSIADGSVYEALDGSEPWWSGGTIEYYTDMFNNITCQVVTGQNMKGMFAGCTSLTTVENIPNGVVKMENTFRDCISLTTVTNFPSFLKDMGKTFMNCSALVDVPQIPDGVINMCGTFKNATSFNPSERVVIPRTCKNLMETFEKCSSMELCPIIYSDAEIYNLYYTFYNCYEMTELPALPNNVFAGVRMFMGCRSAEKVYEDNPIVIKDIAGIEGASIQNYSKSEGLIDAFRGLKKLNADIYLPQLDGISNKEEETYSSGYGSYGDGLCYSIKISDVASTSQPRYINMDSEGNIGSESYSTVPDLITTNEEYSEQVKERMQKFLSIPTIFLEKYTDMNSFSFVPDLCEYVKEIYTDAGYDVDVSCKNSGSAANYYRIKSTRSKLAFWESAIPTENGGSDDSELRIYLPDNDNYTDVSTLVRGTGTTGASYTSNLSVDSYTDYPIISIVYEPNNSEQGDNDALIYLGIQYSPVRYEINYYSYDKTTLLETDYVISGQASVAPTAPDRPNHVTDTSVTKYTFSAWKDISTDSAVNLSSITSNMDVYATYSEAVTYTTKLTLEYYTYSDYDNKVYVSSPHESIVINYGEAIHPSSYVPGNEITHTTTANGFDNTQTWSFEKWEPDTEYTLSGTFNDTSNVTVKLYAKYRLTNESYISTEELDKIVIDTMPDKTEYIVKDTFDDTGLKVDAVYKQTWNDGSITYRTDENVSYDVDKTTPLKLTDTKVVISKTEGSVTKTADVDVNVSDTIDSTVLDYISISTHADKLSYIKGETFDKTGLVVDATYKNTYRSGKITYTVQPGVAYSVDTVTALEPSNAGVDISFSDGGITKHTSESITVKDVFCVNYYSYDKVTLLKADMVVDGQASTAPAVPDRADLVTDTSRTVYTFSAWKDTATDAEAALDSITGSINVYAAYAESVTYTSKLVLNYFVFSDFKESIYESIPHETIVINYGEVIHTSSYVPGNKVTHTTTANGFDNTQTWSFDRWEPDREYALTGTYMDTSNITINLYAKYRLASESYISTEEFEKIVISHMPDKTAYIVKDTFDDTGLKVDAVYKQTWNDGHITYRTDKDVSYDVDKATPLKLTDTKVVVSKAEGSVTKTADVDISVSDIIDSTVLDHISIGTHADKLEYMEGETFDKSGLRVDAMYEVTYRSGKVEYSTRVGVDYVVDTTTELIPSDTGMDISFTDKGVTKHTEENITVKKSYVPTTDSEEPVATGDDGIELIICLGFLLLTLAATGYSAFAGHYARRE